VIDLGSNSIRLSIYKCEKKQILKTFDEKEIAGLAGYVFDGVLQTAGILKACAVINYFKEIAFRFVEPSNVRLFATASLRNISNRDQAVNSIAEKTLLTPDVLEGAEEAALGFSGISHLIHGDSGVMIDIGGASTELVRFVNKKAANLVSLPIGCLNLSAEYVNRIIPTERERKQIKAVIKDQFSKVDWGDSVKCPLLVGTGGTLRATMKLSRALFDLPAEENSIKAGHVKEIAELLYGNKGDIYHTVYRTIPERLMTIPIGLAILQQAIKKFGCKTISVNKFGVREGYLLGRVLQTNDEYVIN